MRIGVFGGTFDPPHVGHLLVAQDALTALQLDSLLWVPARQSPFKVEAAGTSAELRAHMVEAALADHPQFRVWRGELDRPAPSYMVDSLEQLASEHPDAEWTLLLGWDQWASFESWRSPERILELASIGVIQRDGLTSASKPGAPYPYTPVPVRRVDVSSTEVRERMSRGESIRFLVPESVRAVIESHDLYAEFTALSKSLPC